MKQRIYTLWAVLLYMQVQFIYGQSSLQQQVDSLNEKAVMVKRANSNEALRLLFEAERVAQQCNYQQGLAITYLYQGGVYQQKGFKRRALANYYQSLTLSRLLKDSLNIARANQQIALSLKEMNGQLDSSNHLLNQTLAIYTALHKFNDLVNGRNALGINYLDQKNFRGAQALFDSTLQESRRLGYRYGEKKSLYNLGLLYKAMHQYAKAVVYLEQSRAISDSMQDTYSTALCNIGLADIAAADGNQERAIERSTLAFNEARQVGAQQLEQEAIAALIRINRQSGRQAQLIRWQERMIDVQKQLHDTDNSAMEFLDLIRIEEYKNLAAQKKVEAFQQASRQQRLLLVAVVLLLCLLLLTGIPIYLNYKKAQMYSDELKQKNTIIEKNSAALDHMNKAIFRQNQKLEEENLLKDRLISIISHDLRHPLVNTKSILDLINLKLVSARETEELLEQLESQYVRSLSLLDNLLFWIRSQMKGLKIDVAAINLNTLIHSIVEEQRMPLQSKNIQVINTIDPDLQWLAEKEMLKIIFRNLLSNAVKFTPSEGQVFLSSVIHDQYAYIIVRDTGVGMTREVLAKINERQYFSSKGTSNEKGSGFGLVLVHELLDMHQAELLIESEPARGTTLAVKFCLQPG